MTVVNPVEKLELDLDQVVQESHNSGVIYWEALRVFINYCQRLQMLADAEYHAKLQRGESKHER